MEQSIQLETEKIASSIYFIRGEKVIMDFTLAHLYEVEVRTLKRAVRRNIQRFPEDFMFELTKAEYISLRSHFGMLKRGAHAKFLPFAFTEQGVAMLSGILNSPGAIQVNIAIMRAFVQIRRFLESHKELARKIEELEKAVSGYDEKIQLIFSAIRQLMEEKENLPASSARNSIYFLLLPPKEMNISAILNPSRVTRHGSFLISH
jgi:hypothetical protein